MADEAASKTTTDAAAKAASEQAKPKGNPAFRAMGLPNFRLRLPSRNWTIFLTVVGSWSGALWYDRYQKKNVQKKWATLVTHLSDELVPSNGLPRKVTIFLAAPPGDGLRSAREHFLEYVKPVLVAASLNWDVVEGRREGEVRAGLAERIRRIRRKSGEHAQTEATATVEEAIDNVRQRNGVVEAYAVGGDIVIGRHTWKEYVRGLHEGWLGPLDAPPEPVVETPAPPADDNAITLSAAAPPSEPSDSPSTATDDVAANTATTESAEAPKKEEEKKPEEKPKPSVTRPHNTPAQYSEAELPRSIPVEFEPSAPVAFPHLLGFRNTPIRMYRFLTRRHLADDVGRQTAAAVLATHRAYGATPGSDNPTDDREQQRELDWEEGDWQKSSTKRDENEPDKEREWLDGVVLDGRIAERMRRFQVTEEDEERARRISHGGEGIPGRSEKPEMSDYDA